MTAASTGRAAGAGSLAARRRVPAARALVGGFAVTAAAVLVFAAYLDSRPAAGTPEVVAAAPLAAGTQIATGDLRTVEARLPAATRATALSSPGPALGRTLAVGLSPGEIVTSTELTPSGATPARRPVALSVSATDAVDLHDGERVDVLVTEGNSPHTRTTMVLRGADVIAAAAPSGSLAGPGGPEVVTLGVTSLAEVEAVISAEHAGSLDVVVGEPADGSGLGP